jgi:ATP-dependent DNA helicase PIF1
MDGDAAYAVDLLLIVDAQVMLIANTDPAAGLVNGSRGVVVGFCGATGLPEVEFMNGARKVIGHHHWPVEDYEFVSRSQIPLRLAWACTSHKAQGSSLESALVDIGSSNFEFGQCYVSLSRCRSLEALYVHDFDPTAFRIHPKVAAFYQTVRYAALVTVETPNVAMKKNEETPEPERETTRDVIAEVSRRVRGVKVTKEPGE